MLKSDFVSALKKHPRSSNSSADLWTLNLLYAFAASYAATYYFAFSYSYSYAYNYAYAAAAFSYAIEVLD